MANPTDCHFRVKQNLCSGKAGFVFGISTMYVDSNAETVGVKPAKGVSLVLYVRGHTMHDLGEMAFPFTGTACGRALGSRLDPRRWQHGGLLGHRRRSKR